MTTIDVNFVRIGAIVAFEFQRHGGKCLHEFDAIEIADLQAGLRHQPLHGLEAGGQLQNRIVRRFRHGNDSCPRLQTRCFTSLATAEQDQRCTVRHARTIGDGMHVIDQLEATMLCEHRRIEAHRALLRECWLHRRQGIDRQVFPDKFFPVKQYVPRRIPYGFDAGRVNVVLPCSMRALV